MKKYEIDALSVAEMQERIKESKAKIAEVIFKKATEPEQNTMIVRNLRRDIARMKTAIRKKHVESAQETKETAK